MRSSTSRASAMRSTWQRPHVGQLMSSGPRRRRSSAASSVQHARTSVAGSSVSEMRSVSPMPSSKRMPKPHALLTRPWNAVPASVTPMCKGTCGSSSLSRRYVRTVVITSWAFALTTKSRKPRASQWRT